MKKETYVKIALSELVKMQNEIALLRSRLNVYEPPQKPIRLLDKNGNADNAHPFFKPGPKSILERLPDVFTHEDYCRIKGDDNRHAIHVWKWRKYITEGDDGKYHKTEKYLARMAQAKLVNIENDTYPQIINNFN